MHGRVDDTEYTFTMNPLEVAMLWDMIKRGYPGSCPNPKCRTCNRFKQIFTTFGEALVYVDKHHHDEVNKLQDEE